MPTTSKVCPCGSVSPSTCTHCATQFTLTVLTSSNFLRPIERKNVTEDLEVAQALCDLEYGHLRPVFFEEELDGAVLAELVTEDDYNDLAELGISKNDCPWLIEFVRCHRNKQPEAQ